MISLRLGAPTPEAGMSAYYLDRFTKNFIKMKNKLKGVGHQNLTM